MPASMEPRPPRGDDLPYDDGEPMESERHREQMNLLIDSLRHALREREDVYVGGNMAVYFSETQIRKNDFRAPDVFVVLDTERRERKRWVVWEENGRTPDVVIELLSPSTEDVDRGTKKSIYERLLRVPCYVLFDPFSARLEVLRLDLARRRYVPVAPDARGWVPCEPLGLSLGVVPSSWHGIEAPWLRWIDEHGEVLPSTDERAENEARRAENEARRAENEARRADQAEAELAKLREELRRRGDP
jgi:Uma2 family endonuclease